VLIIFDLATPKKLLPNSIQKHIPSVGYSVKIFHIFEDQGLATGAENIQQNQD